MIAAGLGKYPCYGLTSEVGLNCYWWYANVNASSDGGTIDGSDLSWWAYCYGNAHACTVSKAGGEESTEAILAWFGMKYSHEKEVNNGIEMPKVVVVNEAQMQRAILDPYGYRTQTNATSIQGANWSKMKTLYR